MSIDTTLNGATAVDVTLTSDDALELGNVRAADLTVTTGGDLTQSAATTIIALVTDLTATNADITLGEANAFATLALDANAATVNEANATEFTNVDVDDLTLTSGGAVTQSAGTSVLASDSVSITATGFDVSLANATNDFTDALAGVVDVTGANVTLTDLDGIQIGTIAATTSATITAADAGRTGTFNGGLTTVTLTDDSGDMLIDGAAFTIAGTVTTLDATATDVAASIDVQGLDATNAVTSLTAGGGDVAFTTAASQFADLTVSNAANITQNGGALTVTGSTDLTATTSNRADRDQ